VFRRLPPVYRVAVWLCGLAAFGGLAAALSPRTSLHPVPLAGIGLLAGAISVLGFLHALEHPTASARVHKRH
jgi:hypothetical protein